jgi:hypothetical protein
VRLNRGPAGVVIAVLALAGCTEDPVDNAAVRAAERTVVADTDRLADVLERRCTRVRTCPRVKASEVADAVSVQLSKGNEVTFYRGEQFHVTLCVVNKKSGVWTQYHSERGTEIGEAEEPCTFS